MDVVDTHTHVISTDARRYPLDPVGGRQSTWSREHPVDVDGLLRALDDAGIARAVVVQASTVYGHDNRYVLDAVRAHPDRLIGVYSIDALAPDATTTVDRWQQAGLSGFRLFTTGTTMPGQAPWFGREEIRPLWAHAETHDVPVCLQMTLEGVPALVRLLEEFPGIRVLVDHCARPDLGDGRPWRAAAALFALAAYPGVHLKLTHRVLEAAARGSATVGDFLADLIGAFGAGRIAWGSNFPAAEGTLSSILGEVRTALAELPEPAWEQILGGTAQRFYPALATMAGGAGRG